MQFSSSNCTFAIQSSSCSLSCNAFILISNAPHMMFSDGRRGKNLKSRNWGWFHSTLLGQLLTTTSLTQGCILDYFSFSFSYVFYPGQGFKIISQLHHQASHNQTRPPQYSVIERLTKYTIVEACLNQGVFERLTQLHPPSQAWPIRVKHRPQQGLNWRLTN